MHMKQSERSCDNGCMPQSFEICKFKNYCVQIIIIAPLEQKILLVVMILKIVTRFRSSYTKIVIASGDAYTIHGKIVVISEIRN